MNWTSTDVVRIGNARESAAPIILWIGVVPTPLSGNEGAAVVSMCQDLLVEYRIADMEVEIRESVVSHSAGPKFLMPAYSSDHTVDVREPLTTTLGLPVCAQSTPWAEGTCGFFIAEGENTKKLLLVTARHVVFTPDKTKNKHFDRKNDSQCCDNVTLFSDVSFNNYLKSIKVEIAGKALIAQYQERRTKLVEGMDNGAREGTGPVGRGDEGNETAQ